MKVLIIILMLFFPMFLFSSGLAFNGNGVNFSSDYLTLSYPDADFTLSYGEFRYGKISWFEVSELIRPDLAIWEGKSERKKETVLKGFSWRDDVFSFFFAPGTRSFAGSALRLGPFRFSFLIHGNGERSDDILSWSSERGGERGESAAVSYMAEHILLRSVVYVTEESGVNAFFSAGVGYRGVSITYSRGRITAFEKSSSLRRDVFTLDIKSGYLTAEYTLWHGHDPFIGGSYRPHGMRTTVLWKDGMFYLRSDYSRVFSETGKYTVTHTYEALIRGCGIKFNGKSVPVYVVSFSGFRIESDLESFSVSATVKGSWWSLRLGFTSKGVITASVSLSLS